MSSNNAEPIVEIVDPEMDALQAELEGLARIMDDQFRVPGTNIRFGLDALIGLIPGVGDAITGAVTLYLISRAWGIGVPFHVKIRMLANLAADLVLGVVPIVGDVFDVAWRANRKNLQLLQRHLDRSKRLS